MTAAEPSRPADRRPLHDDEAGPLEALHQVRVADGPAPITFAENKKPRLR
jgi:hypothetical protein